MNWISIVKFLPKGKQKFLHPHYYVYKLFPNSDRNSFRYSEVNKLIFVYSKEKPVEPDDIRVEILSINRFEKPIPNKEYSFVIKYSQSIKHNGRRHDIIQHMKHANMDVSDLESIRIKHFVDKCSNIGVTFKDIIVYNRGDEYIYNKKIKKSWVEFRGLLRVNDNTSLFNFLCNGIGTGKGYGLGTMFLGE